MTAFWALRTQTLGAPHWITTNLRAFGLNGGSISGNGASLVSQTGRLQTRLRSSLALKSSHRLGVCSCFLGAISHTISLSLAGIYKAGWWRLLRPCTWHSATGLLVPLALPIRYPSRD
ncbi:hypothetical protein CI102_8096 [Trichoderma harzianum]|nr:hypothetical protein CI102_8096 [Trichoderma harzianum]